MTAVCMSIPVTVLCGALQLPGGAEILAGVTECEQDVVLSLTLMIEFPEAPPGAVAAEPQYVQVPGGHGAEILLGIRWLDADGTETGPRLAAEPIPPAPRRWWYPFGLGGLSDGEPQ